MSYGYNRDHVRFNPPLGDDDKLINFGFNVCGCNMHAKHGYLKNTILYKENNATRAVICNCYDA